MNAFTKFRVTYDGQVTSKNVLYEVAFCYMQFSCHRMSFSHAARPCI